MDKTYTSLFAVAIALLTPGCSHKITKEEQQVRDIATLLVATSCPHCSAELDFRLDGSLFSCNHEFVA